MNTKKSENYIKTYDQFTSFKYKKEIDRYYTFISNEYSLISFDKNGNFSSIFFPDKDYYQNLNFSYSWILYENKIVPLTEENYFIKFEFSKDFKILNIYYYPKYKILSFFNLPVLEKYINLNTNNYFNKEYENYLIGKGFYLYKTIEFKNNFSESLCSKINVKFYNNNLPLLKYIEYFDWKIKDSSNYHSITIKNREDCCKNSVVLFKQEFKFIFNSNQLEYFFPIHFKYRKNNINYLFFNFLTNRDNYKNFDFSTIGIDYQKQKIKKIKIKNYEIISNTYFSVYDFQKEFEGLINIDFSILYEYDRFDNNFDIENKDSIKYNNEIKNQQASINEEEDSNDYYKFKEKSFLEKSSLYILSSFQTRSGAILASFEQDENFEKSGGYGFCWGRDAAIIVNTMINLNFRNYAKKFFKFIFNALNGDDHVHQRYYANGLKAPSWGDQYDETGLILWSFDNYFNKFKDFEFIKNNKNNIMKLTKFLLKIFDESVGFFKPSFDLWEERYGYHLFTQVSCIEGLKAGISLLNILGEENKIKNNFLDNFEMFYENFIKNLKKTFIYNDDGRLNIKRSYIYDFSNLEKNDENPIESNKENDKQKKIKIENNRRKLEERGFLKDYTADISNLCLIYPFDIEILSFKDQINLINKIDASLKNNSNQFHYRYKNDTYMGGNSWIISTLWIMLAKIKVFEYQEKYNMKFYKKDELLNEINLIISKLNNIANDTGFLPEQIDLECNPEWIQPLAWTHALVLELYYKKKKLGGNL